MDFRLNPVLPEAVSSADEHRCVLMTEELDQRLFDRFDQQAEVRHGLPASVYTATGFFQLEARHLFASSWAFLLLKVLLRRGLKGNPSVEVSAFIR